MKDTSNGAAGQTGYPVGRPRFFGMKFMRILQTSCAAQDIGADGVALLAFVVATEDATNYSKPITFHNAELLRALGLKKWDTLGAIRARCVKHGWLHYQPPPKGARTPGWYWVLTPDEPAIPEENHTRETDTVNGKHPRETGTVSGDHTQKHTHDHTRETDNFHPHIPTSPKKRKQVCEARPEHVELASWMFSKIEALDIGARPPNLNSWANEIRLMVERDNRTLEQIRHVFQWANDDVKFWQANILSPKNLREKWSTITAQMKRTNGTTKNIPGTSYDPMQEATDPNFGRM